MRQNAPRTAGRKLLDQRVNRFRSIGLRVVPGVEQLHEYPLRPSVIFRVGGAHLARPIVGEAHVVQLFAVAADVGLGRGGGMLAGLDGVLLGRQAERIVAHRVQHVEALGPFVTRENIGGDVAQRMPHVQPRPGRIGEHVQHVVLRLSPVFRSPERAVLRPEFLPFPLDRSVVVVHFLKLNVQCVFSEQYSFLTTAKYMFYYPILFHEEPKPVFIRNALQS